MKHIRPSLRPVTAIAAVLAAGALLASCSSSTDGDAAATSSATTSAAASSTAADGASESATSSAPDGAIEAELKQAATDYLDAVNTGKVDAILAASCQKVTDELPEGTSDGEPLAQPIVVDKVENVVVDGDTATADVTASLEGAPEAPQTESLMFANENGWKVCQ